MLQEIEKTKANGIWKKTLKTVTGLSEARAAPCQRVLLSAPPSRAHVPALTCRIVYNTVVGVFLYAFPSLLHCVRAAVLPAPRDLGGCPGRNEEVHQDVDDPKAHQGGEVGC